MLENLPSGRLNKTRILFNYRIYGWWRTLWFNLGEYEAEQIGEPDTEVWGEGGHMKELKLMERQFQEIVDIQEICAREMGKVMRSQ